MDSKSFSYEQDTHCHGLDTGSMCSCRRCNEMHHTPSCRVGWMGCYFFGRDVCLEVGWPEAVGGWMHMDVFRMQRAQDNTRGGLTFGTRWSGLRPVLKVSFVVILQMRAAVTFAAHTRQAKQVLAPMGCNV
jgi:hypothetical protein